jgi:hypothetical protein
MPFPQDVPFVPPELVSMTSPMMDDSALTQEALQEYSKLEEEFLAQQGAKQATPFSAASNSTSQQQPPSKQKPSTIQKQPPQQLQSHTGTGSSAQVQPPSSIVPTEKKISSIPSRSQQPMIAPQFAAKSVSNYTPSSVVPSTGYKPSEEDCIEAQKYAKYIVSSLQFDDVPAAISNLKKCFKLLTGQDIPFDP